MARPDTGLYFDVEAAQLRKRDKELIPTRLVIAMFSLAIMTVVLAAIAVLTDRPLVGTPAPADVIAAHEITLTGDGRAMRVETVEGRVLFDGSNGGFISVVNDGLEFARRRAGVSGNPPVTVTEFADGRIALFDPATGWKTELASFGTGNLNVWRAVLSQ